MSINILDILGIAIQIPFQWIKAIC